MYCVLLSTDLQSPQQMGDIRVYYQGGFHIAIVFSSTPPIFIKCILDLPEVQ